MREQLIVRKQSLQDELSKANQKLRETNRQAQELTNLVLRIEGAILVVDELLNAPVEESEVEVIAKKEE